MVNFFMCYDEPPSNDEGWYSSADPLCIPRDQFCDGIVDCGNGRDEQKTGFGFKCRVRDRKEVCLLAPSMAWDAERDCKNGEDTTVTTVGVGGRSPPAEWK